MCTDRFVEIGTSLAFVCIDQIFLSKGGEIRGIQSMAMLSNQFFGLFISSLIHVSASMS